MRDLLRENEGQKVALIKMNRSSDCRTVLIVEGRSDKLFYSRLVDKKRCVVFVAEGRPEAIYIIQELNDADDFDGALGIVDADFDNITAQSVNVENLFSTDLHDLECMLLHSLDFNVLVDELGDSGALSQLRNDQPQTATHLAQNAIPLGCLRLISLRVPLGLTFNGIAFDKFVDSKTAQIDIDFMVKTVINNSGEHQLDKDRLRKQIDEELRKEHDCWQISRGHDIIDLLRCVVQKRINTTPSTPIHRSTIERDLRIACNLADFKESQLYAQITEWDKNHPDYQVLLAG